MINLIMILVGMVSLFVGWIIGSVRQKRKMKRILIQGTGRFGIIEYSWLDHKFTLEIEEMEEAGTLTKVKLIKVVKTVGESYSTDDLLDKVKFKQWVPTSNITWYNNNSQKIRDNKINQILGTTSNP